MISSNPPYVRRLTHVEPLLPALDSVVYDYTIPELSMWTRAVLRGEWSGKEPVYRGYKRRGEIPASGSLEATFLKPYEAARLISAVYSRSLDPLRFHALPDRPLSREQVLESFARTLTSGKLRTAVELVASNLDRLWKLETYQAGTGANTVRWMQYLAREALRAELLRADSNGAEAHRAVHAALCHIRDSVSVPDRFTALARGHADGRGERRD